MTIALAGLSIQYLFIEPDNSLQALHPEDDLRLGLFLFVCLAVYGFNLGVRRLYDELTRSQSNVADFLDNTAIGIHWVEPEGSIIWANQAEMKMLGFQPEEFLGHHVAEFHADQADIDDILMRLRRGESLHDYPSRLRSKDGRILDVLIDANVLWRDGEYVHARFLVRDVTEKRSFETALRESEERYRSLVQATTSIVWTAGPEGDFIQPQPSWQAFTGQGPHEYERFGWLDALHPDFRAPVRAALDKGIEKTQPYEISARLWHQSSGQYRFVDIRGVPVLETGGAIREWVGTCVDVHEAHEAQDALQRSEERMQREHAEAVRLYESESAARSQAELSGRRTAALQSAAAALMEARTEAEIARSVLREAIAVLDAAAGCFWLLDASGAVSKRLAVECLDRQERTFEDAPPASNPVLESAVRNRRAVFTPSPDERQGFSPDVTQAADVGASAAIPILAEAEVIAVLELDWPGSRDFPPDEIDLMFAFGRLASQALERARLYQAEKEARLRAELATARIGRLQAVTAALGETMTQGQVAEAVLREGASALGAATGVIALFDRSAAELYVVASRGLPPEASTQGRYPLTARTPLTLAVTSGRPVLIPNPAAAAPVESFEAPSLENEKSWAVVPIIHNDEVFGALRFSWHDERDFPPEEVELMETLARQTGQAFERARLYQSEQQIRRVAEHSAFQMSRLQAARSALAGALTPAEVAKAILKEGLSALQGSAGAVSIALPDEESLEVIAAEGYPEDVQIAGSRFPVQGSNPVSEAFRLRRPVLYESAKAIERRHPEMKEAQALRRTEGLACVPLLVDDNCFGVLSVSFSQVRALTNSERDLIQAFANQGGQALDRARLYQAQTEARRRAETASGRLGQLQLVTAALSEAATPREVEEVFATRGIAAAEACTGSIYALSGSGAKLTVVTRSGYENGDEISRVLPLSPDLEHLIRTSAPSFIGSLGEMAEELRRIASADGGPGNSWALVPTQHERRPTGLIVFSFEEEQAFDDEHKELLVTLGHQFSEALERARLYQAEKELRARLDAVISDIPGVMWEAWGPPDPRTQRVDFVGDYAETMLGYSSAEWLSVPGFWLSIIHPQDRDAAEKEAAAAFADSQPVVLEFRWVTKEGGVIHAMTHCSVITDAEGRPVGMRGISFDMTEQKRSELALRESELRAKSVLKTAANGIITIDESGTIESMNPAAERIFGHEAAEVIGRNVSMLMPPRDGDRHDSYILNYLTTGQPKIIGIGRDVLGLRKDGSTFDMELAVSELELGGRRIFTGIVNDVSQRKRVMRGIEFLAGASEILSSSLDYDTTLKSLARVAVPAISDWCAIDIWENERPQRVAVVHSDGEKIELAKALQRRATDPNSLAQVREVLRELRPRLFREISADQFERIEDAERREILRSLGLRSAIIAPLLSGSEVLGAITLVNAESGRIFDEQDLALAEELGRRAGIAVENARLYRESRRVQAELRRANEAKDEFLGLVSHELRTPITSIYGGARFLRLRASTVDEHTRTDLIVTMEQEAERLYRLVENLLALARTELQQEIPREPVSLGQIAERAVQAFAKTRPQRAIEIENKANGVIALAEPTYIEQVLQNLISNADKYSPAETPITVSVEGSPRGKEVSVRVLDRGPGIEPEEIKLIFESFYRSSRTARNAPGKGLGLTVCKRLIEALQGRIWARPRKGGGLEVGFALPSAGSSVEAGTRNDGGSTPISQAGPA